MGTLLDELVNQPRDFSVDVYRYQSGGITIERRGDDQWAVCRHGAVYASDGQWEYEPLPSNRDEEFIRRTRYNLHNAYEMAREAWRKSDES